MFNSASEYSLTYQCFKLKKGVCISFDRDMNLTVAKDVFLSNSENKQRFIKFLGETLEALGCTVFHDSGDADLLIVQKAVESASCVETVLVGDDTDLLVLLLHHVPMESKDIFFASERKKNSKGRVWNIKEVQAALGPVLCKNILFSHALLGCDTTSRLFGIGKGSILKKIKQSSVLQNAAKVFENPHSTHAEVENAGEKALVMMYNGKSSDTLYGLRFKKYCDKVATSLTQVDPRMLPPTSAAAKNHSKRVFLQINQWKDPECDMAAEDWSWTLTETGLCPTMTEMAPAPSELLKLIRCSCATDCASARCTCRKHGMKCSTACGQCRGTLCSNANAVMEDRDESDSDED